MLHPLRQIRLPGNSTTLFLATRSQNRSITAAVQAAVFFIHPQPVVCGATTLADRVFQ
jgi:hypothetical protein